MTADRYLTACHEAGHAVAALMRGGHITTITIESTAEYRGRTAGRSSSFDSMFIIFAGPWAEARAQWTGPMGREDDVDEGGRVFEDRVAGAFRGCFDGDGEDYRFALELDPLERARRATDSHHTVVGLDLPDIADRQKLWSRELEGAWPVIQVIAHRLLAGPVNGKDVTEMVRREHTPLRSRCSVQS